MAGDRRPAERPRNQGRVRLHRRLALIEDVIDTLVAKNLINITDLPPEAQAKLFSRKSFRERRTQHSLRLFGDTVGFGNVIDDTQIGPEMACDVFLARRGGGGGVLLWREVGAIWPDPLHTSGNAMLLPKDRGFVHPIASEITPQACVAQRRWRPAAARRHDRAGRVGPRVAWPQTNGTAKGAALPGARSTVPGAMTLEKPRDHRTSRPTTTTTNSAPTSPIRALCAYAQDSPMDRLDRRRRAQTGRVRYR